MEEIKDVVREIVAGCAEHGADCSEVLAAFVARTVVESDGDRFMLDRPLTEADLNVVINESIQRLLTDDSPSLETMRMQVSFDASFLAEDAALREASLVREARLKDMSRRICMHNPAAADSFDGLSGLYKKIFTFLMAHFTPAAAAATRSGKTAAAAELRQMEREVAAALESVFPRIGLKSFLALKVEDRKDQLDELASIVSGIRLFNRHMGKGGSDLSLFDEEAGRLAADALPMIEAEVEEFSDLCMLYQESIVAAAIGRCDVDAETVARWKEELAHRRQYLSFLQALHEDVNVSSQKVDVLRDRYAAELANLDTMVSGRASVPKEHVYPKFDALARLNKQLKGEHDVLQARLATFNVLSDSRDPFESSLAESGGGGAAASAAAALNAKDLVTAVDEEYESAAAVVQLEQDTAAAPEEGEEADAALAAAAEAAAAGGDTPQDRFGAGGERPEKLSLFSTPEFMQLPLEYQGFCVWTVVTRGGLLMPGKPEIGVVRWRNQYYVFAHEVAMTAFMDAPLRFIDSLRSICVQKPELIHLLRVQDQFPGASIPQMLLGGPAGGGAGGAGHIPGVGPEGLPAVSNAGTQTPTHFQERHVDPSYSWNEWELRRRALKVANLRKCKTSSQQTETSTFLRENSSQVYLARENETQTRRDAGTNPVRTVTYVQGLRGANDGSVAKGIVKMSYEI